MFEENDEEIMDASDGSSPGNTFASFVRAKTQGSRVRHLHWLQTLVMLLLLAAQASSDDIPATLSPDSETSVYYFIDLVVTANEPKNESQISYWLSDVFTSKLQSCVSLRATTTSPQTTYETTLMMTVTTTMQSFNTTTPAATTMLPSANTTTPAATTTLPSFNTTTPAATTMLPSANTTTPAATTTLPSFNTTTPAATTTLPSFNTTTPAATTTLPSFNTTTPAATTTLPSFNTTTPAATTTLPSFNTTTPAATTKLPSANTTTPAATTLPSANTTTPVATTTLPSANTTTPAATTTLPSGITTTPAATTTLPSAITPTPATTTPTTRIVRTRPQQGNNGNNNNNGRPRRDIRNHGTQVRTNQIFGLFKGIDITCIKKTAKRETRCLVTLQLHQRISSCCILRTLCAASRESSDIRTVGKSADAHIPLENECDSAIQELNGCTFTGGPEASCEGDAFVSKPNSTHCGKPNKMCRCSAYCNGTDAFYTFTLSTNGSQINVTDVSVSLSSKLKKHTNCSSRVDGSCPPSIIASEFKNATLKCESTKKCLVILSFSREVPICNVSSAVGDVFRSQKEISFNGQVTRAAICGDSIFNAGPGPTSFLLIDFDIKPISFCPALKESYNLTCPSGTPVVVQLGEQCVVDPRPDNAESQANALLALTADVSQLNSSQVAQLVSQLEGLLSGPSVSMGLGNTSVHIVSNLLGASAEVLSDSSDSIIGIVDTVGLKLVLGGEAETLLSPSVALSVKPADGTNFQETIFSISDPSNVQVRGDPRRGRSLRADSTAPQGSIRLPPSLTQDLTGEQQQLATRVQFNFYQESTVYQDRSLKGERKLNSGILGASVSNLSLTELQDDVIIHLRNSEPVPANFVAICVYWDFTLNNHTGGWNPRGCSVRNSTDTETVCGCNHLTSFAILLDLGRDNVISRVQATILTFITYIGCGISAIFLSITILTYLAFGKLRKDIPSKILIQLCLALLLLNLVFLVDAWLALYPDAVGLCISTAWFLHYFLLVTFTWMGLEAVHMYQALVKVFNSHISCYMLKLSLVGWGVPMIVVIIVIAIDKDNYGLVSYGGFSDGTSDGFCWLKNDIAFYVAVVAYFCVIFVFNIAMFIVVLVQLCRLKRQNPHNMQHRTTLQDVRSVAGIMILLGLTWGFAFFAWGPLNLPFMYLFAIFNSFQGFFIFLFYCAVKENVRKQWRTYLCCGRMRLAENSEWSRTATQRTTTRSPESRVISNNSSSSFLASDSTEQVNGVGNSSVQVPVAGDSSGAAVFTSSRRSRKPI
ncbi:uncharacterized protein LOC130188415 isoform X2 [Pseudoliparis swirei]|uniref:uncharacterized protein LOC130188415 isoform X2 n=1 Tax=Pseudoliparis swirei TaxID=2059687 RepID=UPI0024BEC6CC|nr:uncharacterized protein LOC130188415 isoform X2 [Pseudoliparis swirei]